MKILFQLTTLVLLSVVLYSCAKNSNNVETEMSGKFKSLSEVPDDLLKGGDLYGIWKIDSVKTLSGHYYKGDGNVMFAVTNDGNIVVENKSNAALSHVNSYAPSWKINPWYFKSGVESYTTKCIEPSNDISMQDGYPQTGKFSFTENNEQWTAHFSGEKIWLYQWASGNAMVHIWAKKVK